MFRWNVIGVKWLECKYMYLTTNYWIMPFPNTSRGQRRWRRHPPSRCQMDVPPERQQRLKERENHETGFKITQQRFANRRNAEFSVRGLVTHILIWQTESSPLRVSKALSWSLCWTLWRKLNGAPSLTDDLKSTVQHKWAIRFLGQPGHIQSSLLSNVPHAHAFTLFMFPLVQNLCINEVMQTLCTDLWFDVLFPHF